MDGAGEQTLSSVSCTPAKLWFRLFTLWETHPRLTLLMSVARDIASGLAPYWAPSTRPSLGLPPAVDAGPGTA